MSTKQKMSREDLFESVPVYRAIMTLTLPMIIGSLVSIIYNLSDTFFVGMLNDPVQNAAVTLTAPAMVLFYAVTNLFGVGSSSLMSRALGVKDYDRVRRASATGIYFGLLASCAISAVALLLKHPVLTILGTTPETYEATAQYMFWTVGLGAVPGIMNILFSYLLRAEGRSMQASLGSMSGCLLNILIDPFFILPWGLNLGAAGAALATFLSNCVACLYFLILLVRLGDRTYVSITPTHISFRADILKEIFVVGIPGVFQNNLNVISMTILNNLVAGYGPSVVAAIGIASKVNQLPIQIVFGFSGGVMPLIGYNYSARNTKRMKEAIRKTFYIMLTSLAVVLIFFCFAGGPIVRLFMDNDEIVRVGALFLRGYGLSLPFMCVDFMVVGISQSFGKGKDALIFSFLRKAFLEIPLMLGLNGLFGVEGIPFAQCLSEAVMAMVALFVLRGLLVGAEKNERSGE